MPSVAIPIETHFVTRCFLSSTSLPITTYAQISDYDSDKALGDNQFNVGEGPTTLLSETFHSGEVDEDRHISDDKFNTHPNRIVVKPRREFL